MDTPKAKEILTIFRNDGCGIDEQDLDSALTVGIGAIEFCQHFSPDQIPVISPRLASALKDLCSLQTFASAPHSGMKSALPKTSSNPNPHVSPVFPIAKYHPFHSKAGG